MTAAITAGSFCCAGRVKKQAKNGFTRCLCPIEVNRFVSSRVYQDVVGCRFHRLVEMWFDDPEECRSGQMLLNMHRNHLTQYRGYITMR